MENLNYFLRVVDGVYGIYLDSTHGFVLNKREAVAAQEQSILMMVEKNPELANVEYLDNITMFFSKVDPTDPDTESQHQCTQKQYKQRNGKGSLNHKFIGQMCIAMIYQYWEKHFRSKIATELGLKSNDLQDPIMGDLRIFRNSIIHHAGVALPNIIKCEKLKWFSPGEEIFLDNDRMDELIREVKAIAKRHTKKTNENLDNTL